MTDGRKNNSRPRLDAETKKSVKMTVQLRPSTAAWIRAQPRGWLVKIVEQAEKSDPPI